MSLTEGESGALAAGLTGLGASADEHPTVAISGSKITAATTALRQLGIDQKARKILRQGVTSCIRTSKRISGEEIMSFKKP